MTSPYQITRGVKSLLIATTAVFVLQLLPGIGQWINTVGVLVPFNVWARGQVWRLATYMFLHSTVDFSHLLFNMLALWMFGSELEQRWGTKKFLTLYGVFGAGAALFSVFYMVDPVMRSTAVIGASGAVLGLLTAYAAYYPNREILLFFILPVRAWVLVAGYAVWSLLFAFSHGNAIAHLIHLGGIVVAFVYLKSWPTVETWYRGQKQLWDERNMRQRAEEQISRKRYYEEKVDPILRKISREGMGALTKEEKRILDEAGKYNREELKKEKIIPFEIFKDNKKRF